MNKMNMPGFTAGIALNNSGSVNRVIPALPPIGGDTPADRIRDCIDACREAGNSTAVCSKKCRPVSPPYQCTPTDNSVNHYLCVGAMYAWQGACSAECSLLGSVPVVGGVLAAACSAGCEALGNYLRTTCPPQTICV